MSWLSNQLSKAERWLRRNIWNPSKASISAELKARLPEVEAAVEKAVVAYAAATGGEPFAVFLSLAIEQIGLGAAAAKWVQGIIDRLGNGASRSVELPAAVARDYGAKRDAAAVMAAIREEAGKA